MNNNLGIGGTEVKSDAFEAFQDIQLNRTIMAQKLTAMAPVKPEVVEGLTNVEAVFEHYKPSVDILFQNEDGVHVRENLRFSNLGDFGIKGITHQSPFLKDLNTRQDQYQKIIKQLKSNKLLKTALSTPEGKQNLVGALQALLAELQETK
jgi:predicted component of type VI protein secretion system